MPLAAGPRVMAAYALLAAVALGVTSYYAVRANGLSTAAASDYTQLGCSDLSKLRREQTAQTLTETCLRLDRERGHTLVYVVATLICNDLLAFVLRSLHSFYEATLGFGMLAGIALIFYLLLTMVLNAAPVRALTFLLQSAAASLLGVETRAPRPPDAPRARAIAHSAFDVE